MPRPAETEAARPDAKPDQGKTALYDSLEQEMASLLGRPNKTLKLASWGRRVRFKTVAASVAALLFSATPLAAQDISINFGQGAAAGGGGLNERIIQLIALMTVLSLAPSILVMMTSFTRIVVVLSLLRTALGTATAPPNSVVISLALFLTAFVMGPVLTNVYDTGVKPLVANRDHRRSGVRARRGAVARLHGEERPRKGSAAVHGHVGREAAGQTRRSVDAHSWSRLS